MPLSTAFIKFTLWSQISDEKIHRFHNQINPSNLEIEAAQSNLKLSSRTKTGFSFPFPFGHFFLCLIFVIWNYHVHAININTTMPSQAQAKLIYWYNREREIEQDNKKRSKNRRRKWQRITKYGRLLREMEKDFVVAVVVVNVCLFPPLTSSIRWNKVENVRSLIRLWH